KKRFVRKPAARFSNHDGSANSTWCFKNVLHDESYLSFHVIRAYFDDMLLKNARKNGAEALEQMNVDKVELDAPDGIVNVYAKDHEGKTHAYKAKYLLDASGQDTFLGKRLGGKKAYQDLDRIAFLAHWGGVDYVHGIDLGYLNIAYLEQHKSGWFGLQPVGKDRVSVGLVVDRKYLKAEKEKFKKQGIDNWQMALYMQEITNTKLTNDLIVKPKARIVQDMIIVSDFSYFAEKQYGKNWAMIGDAGKFLDPIFASGVYLGMYSARMFANALHTRFTKGVEESEKEIAAAMKHISGAYNLVEKFINIFYDPKGFNLAEMSSTSESNYKNYEMAFSLTHYLLAGDFFNRYETYSGFLDMLSNPKQFARWKNLVVHKPLKDINPCDNTWEEVFGEIDEEFCKSVGQVD
ncbi:MAG TPA: tryptophan 7-halogenase, partial [Flavobacteriales bacterium]|nr:tryptophan 7-halogenase [Flavobacteriales bacterium]